MSGTQSGRMLVAPDENGEPTEYLIIRLHAGPETYNEVATPEATLDRGVVFTKLVAGPQRAYPIGEIQHMDRISAEEYERRVNSENVNWEQA